MTLRQYAARLTKQAGAVKLGAVIAANLKDLGYGG
jgi:hypothetical protein